MVSILLWKILGVILMMTLPISGCGVTSQDIRQEIRDASLGNKEKMEQLEKTYESRRYFGLTSDKSEEWNSTDWSMWMDTQGGGR